MTRKTKADRRAETLSRRTTRRFKARQLAWA